jgi:hypothetical protein
MIPGDAAFIKIFATRGLMGAAIFAKRSISPAMCSVP